MGPVCNTLAVLVSLATSVLGQSCTLFMPYSNMQYLSPANLTLYNITSPCTVACQPGYYGEFCTPMPAAPPQGPWNQPGYYTAGPAIVRTLTLPASLLSQVQYTSQNDVLVALQKAQTSSATLVVVSLSAVSSMSVTPILSPPASGTLDAVVLRRGIVYVSRSFQQALTGSFDVIQITLEGVSQVVMKITYKALLLEVFVDKGTTTAFILTPTSQIAACYPSNKCILLTSTIYTGITGIFCGIDCPGSLYFAYSTKIMKLGGIPSAVTISNPVSDTSLVYCLGGDRDLNLLLYSRASGIVQVNLQSYQTSQISTSGGSSACSLDLSDTYSQILLTDSASTASQVTTTEAYQDICGYGQTSQAAYSNGSSWCTSCPPLPSNAFFITGSPTCEWQCSPGYTQIGSLCTAEVIQPCPAFFQATDDGLCAPSVQPWAPAGMFVSSVQLSPEGLWPSHINPYLLSSNGSATYMAAAGAFYLAQNSTYQWSPLPASVPKTGGTCAVSQSNTYTLLTYQAGVLQSGVLWAAYTTPSNGKTATCLWALQPNGTALQQSRNWALGSQVCSVASDANISSLYLLFCGANYVSRIAQGQTSVTPLAGGGPPGYQDGALLSSSFNGLTSMVYYKGLLYVSDTGNCVLRQVDPLRGVVSTVAGTANVCQRLDGAPGATVYPINLTYSAYSDFMLFMDQYPSEAYPTLRQLHAPTGTLSTIYASPVASGSLTYVLGYTDRILLGRSNVYFQLSSRTQLCPSGTSAYVGTAFAYSQCVPCPTGSFSASGSCVPCSSPSCSKAGQLLTPCQGNADAYCSTCTNKPANTAYTGQSTVPGNATGDGGDCPWAYVPPCPVGYFRNGSNATLCSACPLWSTTLKSGANSVAQCVCMGGGQGSNGECVIPSPLALMPSPCAALSPCSAYTEPAFPFPLINVCQYMVSDSPAAVCACSPGQYIGQIYPKVCVGCPAGLYSPLGRGCENCPYFMEPSTDQWTCRCAAGSYDVAVTAAMPLCLCCPGSALGGSGCVPCGANTFSSTVMPAVEGAAMQCAPCPLGTSAPAGATACASCALGEYRGGADAGCTACPPGLYAPDPTVAVCEACVGNCSGQRESQCPTSEYLVMCSECEAPRPNSAFNGGLNCATSCLEGFFELDGACTNCTHFNASSCPAGSLLVQCSAYADAGCVPCANSSMPAAFAQWVYASDAPGGPSVSCAWECQAGYTPTFAPLPAGVAPVWECKQAGSLSIWDFFTL